MQPLRPHGVSVTLWAPRCHSQAGSSPELRWLELLLGVRNAGALDQAALR